MCNYTTQHRELDFVALRRRKFSINFTLSTVTTERLVIYIERSQVWSYSRFVAHQKLTLHPFCLRYYQHHLHYLYNHSKKLCPTDAYLMKYLVWDRTRNMVKSKEVSLDEEEEGKRTSVKEVAEAVLNKGDTWPSTVD